MLLGSFHLTFSYARFKAFSELVKRSLFSAHSWDIWQVWWTRMGLFWQTNIWLKKRIVSKENSKICLVNTQSGSTAEMLVASPAGDLTLIGTSCWITFTVSRLVSVHQYFWQLFVERKITLLTGSYNVECSYKLFPIIICGSISVFWTCKRKRFITFIFCSRSIEKSMSSSNLKIGSFGHFYNLLT